MFEDRAAIRASAAVCELEARVDRQERVKFSFAAAVSGALCVLPSIAFRSFFLFILSSSPPLSTFPPLRLPQAALDALARRDRHQKHLTANGGPRLAGCAQTKEVWRNLAFRSLLLLLIGLQEARVHANTSTERSSASA